MPELHMWTVAPGDGFDKGAAVVPTVEIQIVFGGNGGRLVLAWVLLAFLVTFVVTRAITRLIRAGRGPFGNTQVGGLHVHHQVPGIFLLLGAGAAEFAYRPDAPWLQVLACAFGAGAALTLDEFALWLHLDDVYWAEQGRKSVDAVLVAAAIAALLLIGVDPLVGDGQDAVAVAVTIGLSVLFSAVAIAKGKIVSALLGVFVPPMALVAAVRLAKPGSPWARWRYPPGSHRLARSAGRYPPGYRTGWDTIKDVLAGTPSPRQ